MHHCLVLNLSDQSHVHGRIEPRRPRRLNGCPERKGPRIPEPMVFDLEIEYALTDGLAVELELPMENISVEAYKVAGQTTFGTLWNHRFIHGAQAIAQ